MCQKVGCDVYEKNLTKSIKLCRECSTPVEPNQTAMGSAVVIDVSCVQWRPEGAAYLLVRYWMGYEFVLEWLSRLRDESFIWNTAFPPAIV